MVQWHTEKVRFTFQYSQPSSICKTGTLVTLNRESSQPKDTQACASVHLSPSRLSRSFRKTAASMSFNPLLLSGASWLETGEWARWKHRWSLTGRTNVCFHQPSSFSDCVAPDTSAYWNLVHAHSYIYSMEFTFNNTHREQWLSSQDRRLPSLGNKQMLNTQWSFALSTDIFSYLNLPLFCLSK